MTSFIRLRIKIVMLNLVTERNYPQTVVAPTMGFIIITQNVLTILFFFKCIETKMAGWSKRCEL